MPELRVEITQADIQAAKTAWLEAVTNGATQGRIDELQLDFYRLMRTQARQIADDLEAIQRRRESA